MWVWNKKKSFPCWYTWIVSFLLYVFHFEHVSCGLLNCLHNLLVYCNPNTEKCYPRLWIFHPQSMEGGGNICEMMYKVCTYVYICIFLCNSFTAPDRFSKGRSLLRSWDTLVYIPWKGQRSELGFLLLGDPYRLLENSCGRDWERSPGTFSTACKTRRGSLYWRRKGWIFEWVFYFTTEWQPSPLLPGPWFGISTKGSRIKTVQPSTEPYLFSTFSRD